MAPIAQIPRALESLLIHTLTPTRTLFTPPSLVHRQADSTVTIVTVPDNTEDDDPTDAQTLTPGAIAGIVIGSIAGFLLLVWIFRSCSNLGAPPGASENPGGRAWYDGVRDEYPANHVKPVRHGGGRSRSRHSHRSHRHHSRGRSRSATPVAVVRERSPRAPPYVYEYDGRRRSRGY